MLVLKKVLERGKNMVKLQIYDTETGDTFNTTDAELGDRKVFGIMSTEHGIPQMTSRVYIEVDDFAWRLINLINSPVRCDDLVIPNDCDKIGSGIKIKGSDVYVLYTFGLEPIDDNMIFWKNDFSEYTIFNFYLVLFKLPIKYNASMNLYIVDNKYLEFNKAYRLDLNERIIRFMEKAVVLR